MQSFRTLHATSDGEKKEKYLQPVSRHFLAFRKTVPFINLEIRLLVLLNASELAEEKDATFCAGPVSRTVPTKQTTTFSSAIVNSSSTFPFLITTKEKRENGPGRIC